MQRINCRFRNGELQMKQYIEIQFWNPKTEDEKSLRPDVHRLTIKNGEFELLYWHNHQMNKLHQ